ncbi:MAG: PH domain-containing protein [candidate division Zixibacteria bacterium]|nr:PH domain-containing protein [candidate division Zixibacteria bacterium]
MVLLWLPVFVLPLTCFITLREDGLQAALFSTVITIAGIALLVWVIVGTYYRITDGSLQVRSGPFRWNIAIKDIQSIAPSRSPLSGPALSLDRLLLVYGKGKTLRISPDRPQEFLADIERAKRLY